MIRRLELFLASIHRIAKQHMANEDEAHTKYVEREPEHLPPFTRASKPCATTKRYAKYCREVCDIECDAHKGSEGVFTPIIPERSNSSWVEIMHDTIYSSDVCEAWFIRTCEAPFVLSAASSTRSRCASSWFSMSATRIACTYSRTSS